jgi:DEAD/DEAH box helicase domain-containing protein
MEPDFARRAISGPGASGEGAPDLLNTSDLHPHRPSSPITQSSERKDIALEAALQRVTSGALAVINSASTVEEPAGHEDRVTAVRYVPAVAGRYAPLPAVLDERLRAALRARGIGELYTHQAAVISHALSGRHVVVTTPTASGKTLCYNAPVLNAILQDSSSRALYLFPTKALAQDQLAELYALSSAIGEASALEIGVHTYDGDTPQDARRTIRSRAHVVLSNPDMLHSGILPHHPKWAKLFENLRFIVIDELHAYRGVFGSHLANVMRRLQRICRHYGSAPVFICSSATIANPRELAERLTEQAFVLVDESGAPRGEKWFVFMNPPLVNRELGIRRSYLSETRRVAGEFLRRNLQAIVFAQSRLATEILTTYLKDDFSTLPGDDQSIRGYRGGYLPGRRREIERGLREGHVRGVVSTNALELGIDIGALDVAVLAGYPGTIAATWQRAGRAGRRSGRSAAVLVASSAPIDQFVVRHPSYFFDASPEHALINPDNLQILLAHVKCAAFELPFSADETFGRENVQHVLHVLAEAGFVHFSSDHGAGSWYWTNESYPADAVSLRSVSSDNFVIVDTTNGADVIGETDFTSGLPTLHPKAIYLLEGKLFQVESLDFEGRKAYVREIDCDYYTDAITYTRVSILDEFERALLSASGAPPPPARAAALEDSLSPPHRGCRVGGPGSSRGPEALGTHGDVHVVSRVVGFKKIKFYTNENVGSGELDLPEQQMHTTAYWLTIPRDVVAALPVTADDRRDGIVGLSFAMRQVAPLLLMCDCHDVGISINSGDDPTQGDDPKIFLYDNYPGGIGFSEPLFRMHRELLSNTRDLITGCECENGCPTCVGPIGETGPLAKTAALRILDMLLKPEPQRAQRKSASEPEVIEN